MTNAFVHDFRSDNVAGAAPEVVNALAAAAIGSADPYGQDPLTTSVTRRLSALFEAEVTVFPVATGTAANALALSALVPPYGAVYCHQESHIHVDECGAPEMATGGAKLVPLAGEGGKLTPATLTAALAGAGIGVVHRVQPAALSLTQATEAGTVYRPQEVAALSDVAHAHGMAVHMDGARFANAVARLGCAPAEVTWKAGVDVLSLGGTKGGCLAAEVVVFFNPAGIWCPRAASCRRSWTPGWPTTCGCGWPATPTPWPTGCRRASPRCRGRNWPIRWRPTRSSCACPPRWPTGWRRRATASTVGRAICCVWSPPSTRRRPS